MVKDLGVAALDSLSNSWTYVNTTGNPFYQCSVKEHSYGLTRLLPFVEGKNIRLIGENLPPEAALIVSFIRCIPLKLRYPVGMEVVVLPGDRTLLVADAGVHGYNDLIGNTVHFNRRLDFTSWSYFLTKIYTTYEIVKHKATANVEYDLWTRVLIGLLSAATLMDMSHELESRLQWELRMRAGA